MPLDGQVAIVTGAGRGLGRAYALELAARGAAVVVNDVGTDLAGNVVEGPSPAQAVVDEIESAGGRAVVDHADVSVARDVQGMTDLALTRYGRIDILVCNAGNMRKLVFSETEEADLASHLAVHVMGSFLAARAVWPHMRARDYGRIVMTTSQVGLYGQRDAAAYGAAKMAVVGLMHGMKLEAQDSGVRVNCIAPFALTRMAEGTFPDSMAPYIDPRCVAPAVAYLASADCSLQGEILIAGGGHFAVARAMETVGIDVDDLSELDAEYIAASLERIVDPAGAHFYPDALTAVGGTFCRLERLAGTHS